MSTIFDKLKVFERDFIKKHTTLVDFRKLGFDLEVTYLVKAERESRDEVHSFLTSSPHINTVVRINNGFDYLVEGVFRNLAEMQVFRDDLERRGVGDLKEFFILEEIRKESFMSLKNLLTHPQGLMPDEVNLHPLP
ncbi:MAG: Lrp/AsnC family transcriptional regulator [Nanoarchaeota archaeon]